MFDVRWQRSENKYLNVCVVLPNRMEITGWCPVLLTGTTWLLVLAERGDSWVTLCIMRAFRLVKCIINRVVINFPGLRIDKN